MPGEADDISMSALEADVRTKSGALEAGAVSLGSSARADGKKLSDCPYRDALGKRFWRAGWLIHDQAQQRWEAQLDEFERTLKKAAPFIDRNDDPAKVSTSQLLGLRYFVIATGDDGPDAAHAWFGDIMKKKRAEYRELPHADR